MIAAVVVGRELALAVDGAAEFAAPDDQRVVEQAALLEIGNQGAGGLVGVAALLARSAWAGCRAGPSRGGRAARSARRARPAAGRAGSWPANVPGVRDSGPYISSTCSGSSRDVGQLGHRRLHAIGHLVLRDPRGDFGIADFGQLQSVELAQIVEHLPPHVRASSPGGFERYSTGSPPERNLTP